MHTANIRDWLAAKLLIRTYNARRRNHLCTLRTPPKRDENKRHTERK